MKTMTKALLCLALAAMMALTAACGSASPVVPDEPEYVPISSSVAPTLTDDTLLRSMRDLLLQGTDPPNRAFTAETALPGSGKWVEVTSDLLLGMAETLCYGSFEKVNMDSVTDPKDELMLTGGSPYCGIQLYLTSDDKTLLWLQVGEEMGQYQYDAEVFAELKALADAATKESVLALEGDSTALDSIHAYPEDWVMGVVQNAGGSRVAVAYQGYHGTNDDATSAFEVFDAESGASLYYTSFDAGITAFEATYMDGYDCILTFDDGHVEYRQLTEPETPSSHSLPQALLDKLAEPVESGPDLRGFTIAPAYGLTVYTDKDGVYLSRSGGAPRLVVPSSAITPENTGAKYEPTDPEMAPCFMNPHVTNGGASIVLEVIYPDSQDGLAGIMVYDVSSGNTVWLQESFRLGMLTEIAFPRDDTVAVMGESSYLLVWLPQMQATRFEFENTGVGVWTEDFNSYVYSYQEIAANGEAFTRLFTSVPEEYFFRAGGSDIPMSVYGITGRWMLMGSYTGNLQLLLVPRP